LQGVAKDQSLKAAAAQRDVAKSHLQTSQVQLGYAKVYSHIAGIVTDRPLFVGETATADHPLLTIMDLSSVIARVHVSQEDATQFKVGAPANLYPVEAGGKAVPGKVTQISSAIDPANTTIEVWVQAANPGMQMRAGTSIHVEIVPQVVPDALVIPEPAVVTGGNGATSVFIVGPGDKPVKQAVTLGIHEAGKVQVTSGVKSGDRVVVKGAYELSKLESDVLGKTKLAVQAVPEPPDPDEEEEK
jgi:RND family efflux transporter MFP subunit